MYSFNFFISLNINLHIGIIQISRHININHITSIINITYKVITIILIVFYFIIFRAKGDYYLITGNEPPFMLLQDKEDL